MNQPTLPRRRPLWWRLIRIPLYAYLGLLVVLLFLERKFVFIPTPAEREWKEPADSRTQDVTFAASTGERIHAWWLPKPGSKRALLYSHGNALNLSYRGGGIARWAQELDCSVLIYDYPGYGKSTGKPDESNCYAAAEAAHEWLTGTQHIAPRDITLLGVSLGGAMATELATRHDAHALILLKSFSSIPDMASFRFPWLPARYLVRLQFDSVAKLPQVRRPVFIVHGEGDTVVPVYCSERLYAAANEPREFLRLDGNDHNDPLPADFFDHLRRFLAAIAD